MSIAIGVPDVPRHLQALGSHIVPAKFTQSIGHELTGDLFAPTHVEVRIVERLRQSCRERGSLRDCLFVEGATQEGTRCLGGNNWARSAGAENDSGLLDDTARRWTPRCRHGEHREVEGPPPPQLPVGALPSVNGTQPY